MDSRARLVGDSWLNDIARREHKFILSPHPLAPHLTRQAFLENAKTVMDTHGFTHPVLVLGVLPRLTLQPDADGKYSIETFANAIGKNEPLHVIDVETQQNTPEKWTVGRWVSYFTRPPPKRHKILNVISLEFSHTPFARYVRAPDVVLDVDWVHTLWPEDETRKWTELNRQATVQAGAVYDRVTNEKLNYPKASYYFLTGVSGCYTDFHIDFGGSSVWYNVIQGRKEFFAIPPTEENLEKFEEWANSPEQEHTFFGDIAGPVVKIVVHAGQTLFLPSGWIHAVYTPEDSMVIGGNFLHKYNVDMQIKIADLEDRTQVALNARFPFWWLLQFYYLKNYVHLTVARRMELVKSGQVHSMPDWERRGLLALREWVISHASLLPEGVLTYPLQYYLDVVTFRLRGLLPLDFAGWKEFIKTPRGLCICNTPSEFLFVYNEQTNTITEQFLDNIAANSSREAMSGEVNWIGCDWCGEWIHNVCVGVPKDHNLPMYFCPNCVPFGPHELKPNFTSPSPFFALSVSMAPKPQIHTTALPLPVQAPVPQAAPKIVLSAPKPPEPLTSIPAPKFVISPPRPLETEIQQPVVTSNTIAIPPVAPVKPEPGPSVPPPVKKPLFTLGGKNAQALAESQSTLAKSDPAPLVKASESAQPQQSRSGLKFTLGGKPSSGAAKSGPPKAKSAPKRPPRPKKRKIDELDEEFEDDDEVGSLLGEQSEDEEYDPSKKRKVVGEEEEDDDVDSFVSDISDDGEEPVVEEKPKPKKTARPARKRAKTDDFMVDDDFGDGDEDY